jgi:outer membrane protein assembly factor BamD
MKFCLPIALAAVLLVSVAGCSVPSVSWLSSPPMADATAEALFEEGNRAFTEKKYSRALDHYTKIRTDHPFTPLMTQVELKIADAYYLNQQYPEAINGFKEFQSMHPNNENIPFVILRLGQAHFDQFTTTDRDQKNTEIAKTYFETVITNYPTSPQAAVARAKLAKALEYLAEHEFNIAQFYLTQEKYSAARDRLEEIIRKYKSTPTAVKSLFYLGESYRLEKNPARAALAYEALLQHYPESKFAAEAQTQLAAVEKEKRDPLELVLRRDRRPGAAPAPEVKEDPALAKLKEQNLIAKNEVVYEEPGEEKGFFRRVANKLNPFSDSDTDAKNDNGKRKEPPPPQTGMDVITRRQQEQKNESSGFFSSLWPFGGKSTKQVATSTQTNANANAVVSQVDESLKQKGVSESAKDAANNPPPADLPKVEVKQAPVVDTSVLLSSIDGKLQKDGMNAAEVPPPPEAAAAFREYAANQAAMAKNTAQKGAPTTGAVLSSIDEKLKAQGVGPGQFERPPTAEEIKATEAQSKQVKNVQLEPKIALEKGPLFLNPSEVAAPEKTGASATATTEIKPIETNPDTGRSAPAAPDRVLVKGPIATPAGLGTVKPDAQSASVQSDEPKGAFEQLRQDMENVSKTLNPFRW